MEVRSNSLCIAEAFTKYLELDVAQDKLEDEPGNTVVLRKNYGMDIELKRPDSQAQAQSEMANYRALFSCGREPANMRDHLNLKQYMRWIALMDILRCGDYVDEVR
jgi:hypothetical protein